MRNFLNFQLWGFLFSRRAQHFPCRSGRERVWTLPSQCLLEEPCVHRKVSLFMFKLQNGEEKTCSVFLLALFYLLTSIWWFFFEGFGNTVEMKSCSLPLSASLQPEILLRAVRNKEKIPPSGEHPVCWTPSAGPLWTLWLPHILPHTHIHILCMYLLLLFPFTIWGHLPSSSLFTHLPSITSHQTALGEFISVYNMLWGCLNNGAVTLFHFYRLFYLKIKVVSYHYHDWIIAA